MEKVNPDAAGFDAARLARVDEHLRTRYVDAGKIAGYEVAVVRRGHLAHRSAIGDRDRERGVAVGDDTIWRWYSMTKPVTGVALLSLFERGVFQLSDPVARFIPEFADLKVKQKTPAGATVLVEPERPMSIRDAMMHMTGIGMGPRGARLDLDNLAKTVSAGPLSPTLQGLMENLATQPLVFHPGTHWLYSWSTDVCARLVEVMSGQTFDEYLRQTVFGPLGMTSAGFSVAEGDGDRLAALYARGADKHLRLLDDPATSRARQPTTFFSGGGGLLGSTDDYLRFTRMLLGGGELDGVRVLGPRTVALMSSNHLPGGGDLRSVALPGGYGEVGFEGMGFGLTVAVSNGPVATAAAGSAGEYMWGGAASTIFWIDPAEELIVVFMTQLIPSGTFNFRGQLKSLVYSAIVE